MMVCIVDPPPMLALAIQENGDIGQAFGIQCIGNVIHLGRISADAKSWVFREEGHSHLQRPRMDPCL
jgi:hypothetical protein